MAGRYKAYPEYKKSGINWIGSIPTLWKVVSLRHLISSVKNGSTATQTEQSATSVPVSRIETISTGHINMDKTGFVDPNSISESFKLDAGDLLLSHINSLSMVGNVAQVQPNDFLFHGMNLLRIIPKESISSKYLFWQLKSDYSRKLIESVAKPAINQASVSTESLKALQMLLPSIEEQQKIANFLDHETAKIDTLIAKQEKLIELLKEKRQAVISHAVTKGLNPDAPMKDSGVEWLGEVPEHWDMKRLKYIGEARNGLTYSPDDVVTQEEGILVLRSSNIQDARLSFSDNVYVNMDIPTRIRTKENDLLICSRNGSRQLIGKNALITKEAADMAFGAFMVVFRSKINPYLYWVLNSPLFDYQSGSFLTSTINQLTIGNLENMEIPLPPECEQEEIKNYLIKKSDYFDDLTSKALHKVNLLKERKTALISAAVTGKIDVRDWQPQGVQDE